MSRNLWSGRFTSTPCIKLCNVVFQALDQSLSSNHEMPNRTSILQSHSKWYGRIRELDNGSSDLWNPNKCSKTYSFHVHGLACTALLFCSPLYLSFPLTHRSRIIPQILSESFGNFSHKVQMVGIPYRNNPNLYFHWVDLDLNPICLYSLLF